jgi:hypothetical protein
MKKTILSLAFLSLSFLAVTSSCREIGGAQSTGSPQTIKPKNETSFVSFKGSQCLYTNAPKIKA